MTQAIIEGLLREKIGLETASIGSNTIARAIRIRMAECGVSDISTYLIRLQTLPQEFAELIEIIIVPETWFFRDREPFNYLSHYVMTEWLPKNPGGNLRVLSVPCSTGEEPYSIAIALIEAGLGIKHFHIDAVDISNKSLTKAKRAIYERNSFRGQYLEFRDRYFQQTANGYQLSELITNTVNFIHSNFLDPNFLIDRPAYNIIFCRNLLIYLDTSAREKAIRILDRLLTKKGLLFVGHSETGQLLNSKFMSMRHSLAFAYRKLEDVSKKSEVAKTQIPTLLTAQPKTLSYRSLPKPESIKTLAIDKLPIKPNNQTPTTSNQSQLKKQAINEDLILENARILADQGRLDEAANLCKTYLSQNRVSAEAYLLLGEIHQATGNNEQAEEYFQKVIYLQPDHEAALIHLTLLKERRGDFASAEVLRQRIQRIQR